MKENVGFLVDLRELQFLTHFPAWDFGVVYAVVPISNLRTINDGATPLLTSKTIIIPLSKSCLQEPCN